MPATRAAAAPQPASHPIDRPPAARAFVIDAARLAAHTRCHRVVVLDVRGLSPVTDYFVIANGTSARQMRTVADELAELGETQGHTPLSTSGLDGESWILIDFVDVVIHIFSAESRNFYDLDNLWGDAKKVEWEDGSEGKTRNPQERDS